MPKRIIVEGATGPSRLETRRTEYEKVCSQCGKSKSLDKFASRTKVPKPANDPTKYVAACKECTRAVNSKPLQRKPPKVIRRDRHGAEQAQAWREKKKKHRAAQASYKRQYRRETRIKILQYLASQGCEDCGENDPRVLEFDHRDPSKKKENVSRMVSLGYRWTDGGILDTEIGKCRIICANCHRLHTIQQQDYYSDPEIKSALDKIIADYGLDE